VRQHWPEHHGDGLSVPMAGWEPGSRLPSRCGQDTAGVSQAQLAIRPDKPLRAWTRGVSPLGARLNPCASHGAGACLVDLRLIAEAVLLGLLTGSIYALMASGLTLIFGVMDIINIAQGAFVILGAYLSYVLAQNFHVDLFVGLLITMPAMFGLG